MKKAIKMAIVLLAMLVSLVSLGGCFYGYPVHDHGGGYGHGRHDRHGWGDRHDHYYRGGGYYHDRDEELGR